MPEENSPLNANEDRRRFIQSCGRFAVTVPPAITILLSTSLSSAAIAASTGGGGAGRDTGPGPNHDTGGPSLDHPGPNLDHPGPNLDPGRKTSGTYN